MTINPGRRHSRRVSLILPLFLAVCLSPATAGQKYAFDRIYGLGDSLMDTGNVAAILGLPDGIVHDLDGEPLDVVLKDGRFSDGPLMIERLAASIIRFPDGAKASAAGGNNFAIAGALSNTEFQPWAPVSLPGSDLLAQTRNLIALKGAELDKKSLVVIFIGSNDLFSAIRAVGAPGAPDLAHALTRSATIVIEAMKLLNAAGAENFMVFDAPNAARTAGLVNRVQLGEAPPLSLPLATLFALIYNDGLTKQINALKTDTRFKANVWLFSTFTMSELIGGPIGVNLLGLPSTTPCAPELGLGQSCSSSGFWDWVHPSTKVHGIIADTARISLQFPPVVRR